MKNQLSFGLTATIMVVSLFLYMGLLLWLQTTLNLPDWVSTIGQMLLFLLIFEIPARLGPEPFETFLSGTSRLPLKDKIILLVSLVMFVLLVTLTNDSKDQLSLPTRLMFVALMFFLILGPIWLFGSPEAKSLLFKTKGQNKKLEK
jgi:hypothetical protein